jgi:hypothetical protein
VSWARCSAPRAASQNRDRTKHRRSLRPRLCSAPRPEELEPEAPAFRFPCHENHISGHRRRLEQRQHAEPAQVSLIVDKKLLARLKKLLERTGAKVVLSSSWRCDPVGLFAAKHWGVPFVDTCPDKPRSPRRNEMLAWLRDHPRVTRYAVIDDEDDELDDLPLFQPSAKTGLTMEIVRAATKYLNGENDETMRASAVVRLGQNIHSLFKRNKS